MPYSQSKPCLLCQFCNCHWQFWVRGGSKVNGERERRLFFRVIKVRVIGRYHTPVFQQVGANARGMCCACGTTHVASRAVLYVWDGVCLSLCLGISDCGFGLRGSAQTAHVVLHHIGWCLRVGVSLPLLLLRICHACGSAQAAHCSCYTTYVVFLGGVCLLYRCDRMSCVATLFLK